jgi:DNA-binding PadR family transcriptional regulator
MASSSVSFRRVILGLLSKRSMSGYDIRRLLRSLGSLLGNPSFGTIYPALHALLKDGLVTVEVVPHASRPPRKIYTITETGKQALQEWAVQPLSSSMGLRSFIMNLILAGDAIPDGLTALFRKRSEAVAAYRSVLEQVNDELAGQASQGELVAIEYALAIGNAELAWLGSRLGQLSTEAEENLSEKVT